jgi:hypothetical protein
MTVSLAVAAEGHTPALLLRPWQAADMPGLLAAMHHDYGCFPAGDTHSSLTCEEWWLNPRDLRAIPETITRASRHAN